MPKKIRFESFKYHFLKILSKTINDQVVRKFDKEKLINNIKFKPIDKSVKVSWEYPNLGDCIFDIKNVYFYQRENNKFNEIKEIKNKNDKYFISCVNIFLDKINLNE
ncbi:hypothetical protein [Candidatus Pelagibacter communis]|uniref:hypothetical protein n=1 Tax=Pelagibacter ubique TaxID=198252 RepID=UPI000A92E798|nr:hypothetical protein [Candidatus Pelagibacter ubique]